MSSLGTAVARGVTGTVSQRVAGFVNDTKMCHLLWFCYMKFLICTNCNSDYFGYNILCVKSVGKPQKGAEVCNCL